MPNIGKFWNSGNYFTILESFPFFVFFFCFLITLISTGYPCNFTPSIYTTEIETQVYKNNCSRIFKAILFIVAQTQKQLHSHQQDT